MLNSCLWDPHDCIRAFIRRDTREISLHHVRTQPEGSCLQARKSPHQEPNQLAHRSWMYSLQAVRNKFLLSKPPSLNFVMAA